MRNLIEPFLPLFPTLEITRHTPGFTGVIFEVQVTDTSGKKYRSTMEFHPDQQYNETAIRYFVAEFLIDIISDKFKTHETKTPLNSPEFERPKIGLNPLGQCRETFERSRGKRFGCE